MNRGNNGPFWEELLLRLIGGDLDSVARVNGVIFGTKDTEDSISIWMKTSRLRDRDAMEEYLKSIWHISKKAKLEYRVHPVWNGSKLIFSHKKTFW